MMDTRGWRDHLFGSDSIVGYDLIITPPRQREAVPCRVCGSLCNERRNLYGAAETAAENAAELGPRLMLHDRFECPHRGADWHRDARGLVRAIDGAEDPAARAELYARLERLLRARRMPAPGAAGGRGQDC